MEQQLRLAATSGNAQIDAILTGTIGLLETALPERIRAYYLHGSFFDHTGIATSDIDLFLVANGSFTAAERAIIQRIMHYCSLFSPFMAELNALDEGPLLANGHYRIQAASNLLWGRDIREQLPLQSMEQYLHLYAHFPYIYIANMLRQLENIVPPLTYPDADGEFYGYDQPLMPPQNEPRRNIKKFVTSVCWSATVLLAWQAGQTVPGKQASVHMYRAHINDEWTQFIEDVYTWGNQRWHYLIPEALAERQRLRSLCQQALAFEQHYIQHYRNYLHQQLDTNGPDAQLAQKRLHGWK
ncbi:hypothetical protein KDA_41500 [Dictyobacter alpinus]|uniref:Adenylyltransferase AadA C-terminal domain-containing protein n=1 Tax=Dictyobacter alpinus TaxID=2014873 RepID=A0A402BBH3_9CHLR|nr:hypothetical protein [Dictyobacter alpinus]GCE28666.1 hypothetical protein KDA_41500 [Dictyobacter alpinus]